jgi:hypothetical protein
MRKGMWDKVASRKHKADRIFAFDSGSNEVMLYGTVDYGMKDGNKSTKEYEIPSHTTLLILRRLVSC